MDLEKLLAVKDGIVRDAERIYLLTELVNDVEKHSDAQTLASLSNELAGSVDIRPTNLLTASGTLPCTTHPSSTRRAAVSSCSTAHRSRHGLTSESGSVTIKTQELCNLLPHCPKNILDKGTELEVELETSHC